MNAIHATRSRGEPRLGAHAPKHAAAAAVTAGRPPVFHLRRGLPVAVVAVLAVVAALMTTPAKAATTSMLVGIRAAAHPTYDRVVFDFTGAGPSRVSVGWVSQLIGDASGEPVPISGRAVLQVTMHGVDAHDAGGHATVPARTAYPLKNVITTVQAGDYEAVVTYGIGLAAKTSFSTVRLTSPTRFVVDVSTSSLTTVGRSVYFFDDVKMAKNIDPPVTAVGRPVLATSPATGVMDRLYAGPTPAETAAGLRFVASKSTSFSHLGIDAYRLARVRLEGGCDSGGAAEATVQAEIFPSLKQFPTVNWVKIYDPAGHTGTPTGQSDSIPACLEP